MNRILAIFWLIVALLDFGWAWTDPDTHPSLRGTNISFGWLAVFLAFYNVVRWWGTRLTATPKTTPQPSLGRRRHHVAEVPPDPNFKFTASVPPTGITKSKEKS